MLEVEKWLDERHILAVVFGLDTLARTGGKFFDGALETLEMFRKTEIRMGLIAYENIGWVNFMLDLGVGKFDHIEIVNPFGDRGPQDWRNAFGALKIWPQNGIVVGDNLPEDIHEIGVRYSVCVSRNGEIHRAKTGHEGTINIGSVACVTSALLVAGRLRNKVMVK
ncbi:MAG: hypothetical protein AAB973_00040 [Patescibacteria group bacterium]